ncbi:MAG: DUF4340 domain-containing protein [Clostridia bacterium]|nr:DUF4340 domain-containing protein [Clostridia bacterium]
MARKKNRGANLFLAIAVLVFCIVLYVVVVPKLANDNSSEETTSIEMIADYKSGDIEKMSYVYKAGSDEEIALQFRYVYSTGKWLLDTDSDFPLNQTMIQNMASSIVSIPMERRIEKGEITLSDAGLDNPTLSVTVQYAFGDITYSLGNYNSFSSAYYLSVSGDDNIYMTKSPLISTFFYDLYELAELYRVPMLTADNVILYDVALADSVETYSDTAHIAYLSALSVYSAVDYDPNEETLANYVLDGSMPTLKIKYTETQIVQNSDSSLSSSANLTKEKELVIKIGGLCEGDDDKRYVMIDDSQLVYTMSASTLNSLIDPTVGQSNTETN